MLRIGLTGGIGAGKSTVARRLAQLGAVVVDADVIAREVVAPGTEGLAAIRTAFGDAVLTPDGALDREALGRIVFDDPASRKQLEQITHPLIAALTRQRLDQVDARAIAVHDIPLLVELHRDIDYHLTVVVAANEKLRSERLQRDRGMSREDALRRIGAQANDDERRDAADVWLVNEAGKEDLLGAVDELWERRVLPFDANLRADRGVWRREQVESVDRDPAWLRDAARMVRRVRAQLDRAGYGRLPVDHIGSTAVAGVDANDIIDILVQVPELTIPQRDSFRDALRAAGVVELRANAEQQQPWAPEPSRWDAFFATGADPARVLHVHIRVAGGSGAGVALAFRDFLRTEPPERAAYEAVTHQPRD